MEEERDTAGEMPDFEVDIQEKITPNQVYDVITSRKAEWQSIIYDLINSEQLDPWDIDIIILTHKYFERISNFEQDPDFYISSKVLLAAAILLRIKSEFLLNRYVKSIDEILFGKKEVTPKGVERIEINEDELPFLIPKTPLPRLRRITLPELMEALDKAIMTETRRIKRELSIKRAHKLSQVDIPTFRRINIKDRIRELHARILTALKKEERGERVTYSKLVGEEKEHKLACFLPLLHLSNSKKLWLEQEKHLDDITIYLYNHFEKNKHLFLQDVEEDINEMRAELAEETAENIDENKSGLEKAQEKLHEKKKLQEDIRKELSVELGEIEELAKVVVEDEEREKLTEKVYETTDREENKE